jgi:hypothetical protein
MLNDLKKLREKINISDDVARFDPIVMECRNMVNLLSLSLPQKQRDRLEETACGKLQNVKVKIESGGGADEKTLEYVQNAVKEVGKSIDGKLKILEEDLSKEKNIVNNILSKDFLKQEQRVGLRAVKRTFPGYLSKQDQKNVKEFRRKKALRNNLEISLYNSNLSKERRKELEKEIMKEKYEGEELIPNEILNSRISLLEKRSEQLERIGKALEEKKEELKKIKYEPTPESREALRRLARKQDIECNEAYKKLKEMKKKLKAILMKMLVGPLKSFRADCIIGPGIFSPGGKLPSSLKMLEKELKEHREQCIIMEARLKKIKEFLKEQKNPEEVDIFIRKDKNEEEKLKVKSELVERKGIEREKSIKLKHDKLESEAIGAGIQR